MKKIAILLAGSVFCLAAVTNAVVIAEDLFVATGTGSATNGIYMHGGGTLTAGILKNSPNTNVTVTGFTGGWSGSGYITVQPVAGTNQPVTGTNCYANIRMQSIASAYRSLSAYADRMTNTYYFSMSVSVDKLLSSAQSAYFGFMGDLTSLPAEGATKYGFLLGIESNGSTMSLIARTRQSDGSPANTLKDTTVLSGLQPGQRYDIVVRLDRNISSSTDGLSIWVNPVDAVEGNNAPQLVFNASSSSKFMGAFNQNDINTFGMYSGGTDTANTANVMIDNVLMATTWTEVTTLKAINAGDNGNNTRNGLDRFNTDVAAVKPDVCFIALGMNDAVSDTNPVWTNEYRTNLNALVQLCYTNGIIPVLVNINPVNEPALYERHDINFYLSRGGANAIIDSYNAVVASVAQQTGTDLIDWHERVMSISGTSTATGALLRVDGVHLSQEGIHELAKMAADWIETNGFETAWVEALGDSITKQGWINRASAALNRDWLPTYESTIPSAGSHLDSIPPSRLLDAVYQSVSSDSIEYDGNPEITFEFAQTRTVNEIEVCCFNSSGYSLNSVTLEVSTNGATWQTVGTVAGASIPAAVETAAKIWFPVKQNILSFRIKAVRKAGSSRVLISEVFIR